MGLFFWESWVSFLDPQAKMFWSHGPLFWTPRPFFHDFLKTKKDAQRLYDQFGGGIAPRSLLCVRKRKFLFWPKILDFQVWPGPGQAWTSGVGVRCRLLNSLYSWFCVPVCVYGMLISLASLCQWLSATIAGPTAMKTAAT